METFGYASPKSYVTISKNKPIAIETFGYTSPKSYVTVSRTF